MAAFRKFDPYTFLADRERGGAPSEAAAETSETLAPLAREHPQDENKRSEDKYGTDKWVTHAEAVKFVKAVDDGTGILATLANLAPVPSENDENEKSEPPIAKAANPSTAHIRGTAEGLGAKRAEPTPAKATKPANPSEPALLAPEPGSTVLAR